MPLPPQCFGLLQPLPSRAAAASAAGLVVLSDAMAREMLAGLPENDLALAAAP